MNMFRKIGLALVALVALAGCKSGMDGDSFGYGDGPVSAKQRDLVVNAGDRVFFAFDSSSLDEQAKVTLRKQAEWLVKNSDAVAVIAGHCDIRGTREYNLALGERRAEAVRKFLVANGISENRLSTVSYGKERPSVDGNTAEAHAQNRRGVTLVQ